MHAAMKRILFWAPRILCILFTAFLSLFSLDVFGEGYGFGETVLALFMHLLPVFFIILLLIAAWRWEWIGAILFIALALFYVVITKGREHWGAYATISGSLTVMGVLFLLNWIYRGRIRSR